MAKKAKTAAATPTPERHLRDRPSARRSSAPERNEHAMLMEKLGEFANTPLGKAVMARQRRE